MGYLGIYNNTLSGNTFRLYLSDYGRSIIGTGKGLMGSITQFGLGDSDIDYRRFVGSGSCSGQTGLSAFTGSCFYDLPDARGGEPTSTKQSFGTLPSIFRGARTNIKSGVISLLDTTLGVGPTNTSTLWAKYKKPEISGLLRKYGGKTGDELKAEGKINNMPNKKSEKKSLNESLGAPMSFLIIITLLHLLATGMVWGVLQLVTKKFSFFKSESLNKSCNRYPWLLSLLLTLALLLAFAIPGYPKPDVANYGFLLGKLLLLAIGCGLFSLGCWGRMINKPELSTLHLAIIGMITSAVGLIFLFWVGSASPV